MQAHAATAVVICKKPDCPNEAPARGRFAGWCDEHRNLTPSHNPLSNQATKGGAVPPTTPRAPKQTLAQKVRELAKLAARVDKAKATATAATEKALALKRDADTLEKQLREAMEAI